jgi:diphosphomevalonate decarboxylase
MSTFNEFRFQKVTTELNTEWQCASNIAIVKYWGKKTGQIPTNPSLSFTLKNAVTQTRLELSPSSEFSLEFWFDNKRQALFEKRIFHYLNDFHLIIPFLKNASVKISSQNNFPYSSGIASSASGFGAIALGLTEIASQLSETPIPEMQFFRNASFLARLGSGSAGRSVYGGWVEWGKNSLNSDSSDLFAQKLKHKVHPNFQNIQDTILIVSDQPKPVSSSAGHLLMNGHPFSEARYKQANSNFETLNFILQSGNWELFARYVENEAISLHTMMMSSIPSLIMMNPMSLDIIQKLIQFRKETQTLFAFTLDAGPNIHLLSPPSSTKLLQEFIRSEIKTKILYALEDEIGDGPVNLNAVSRNQA